VKDVEFLMASGRKIWDLSLENNKINICSICNKKLKKEIKEIKEIEKKVM
jgi:hypothetical protein